MSNDRLKYAQTLALAIERVRESAEPGEPQKLALKALWAQSDEASATFRMYGDTLTVDGEQLPDTPAMQLLAERLLAHNVMELVIARHAEATELLALARGLAMEPPGGRIKERLRDVGSNKVMVIIANQREFEGLHRSAGVTAAFHRIQMDEEAKSEWNRFLDNAAQKAQDRHVDLGATGGSAESGSADERMGGSKGGGYAPDVRSPIPDPRLPQPPTLQASSPLGIALARLLANPYGKDYLVLLTQLQRQVEETMRADKVPEVIDALNTVIELESKAPAENVAGGYAATLRRLLTGGTLAQVAPYLLESKRARRAAVLLTRGRDASLDLMVGLLASAQTVGERMIYLDVVRKLPQGVDRVVALLSRRELQVLCNISEVVGEAKLEEAVPYLGGLLEHADQRVRRAALTAMAKIGTRQTVEPLRRVLNEGPPELRHLVAVNIGGQQARGLTAPLAQAVEAEEKIELVREYCRALGRIGTPEAVQVLSRAAEPGGKLLGRKPTPKRLAALEGLRLAGAVAALQVLSSDGDRSVRDAAVAALSAK